MSDKIPLHVELGLWLTKEDYKLVARYRKNKKFFMRKKLYKAFRKLEELGKLKIHKYTGYMILLREEGKPGIDYDISNDRYFNTSTKKWYNGFDSFLKYYLGD